MPVDEDVESEFSGSDNSNNVGLENGHSSDDQWSGGGHGTAGVMVEEGSDNSDDAW